MDHLLWVDWLILAVLAFSCIISVIRGFVREALSLASWVCAFVVARTFHPNLETLLADSVSTPSVRMAAAFLILFLATLVVGALIGHLIGKLVHASGLSALDRSLGMIFGFVRGVVVIVVAVALLRLTPVVQDAWWNESVLIQKAQTLEQWSRKTLSAGTVADCERARMLQNTVRRSSHGTVSCPETTG